MINISKYKLKLVKEEGARYDFDCKNINDPDALFSLFQKFFEMSEEAEEIVVMICFDVKNKPIGIFEVSRGTLSSAQLHPREIFKRAILCNASCIALAHNHPSGDPTPSNKDIQITKRIVDSGKILGIDVLDHLIIADYNYNSFKKLGYL
jgi:DNA repair protein RadC